MIKTKTNELKQNSLHTFIFFANISFTSFIYTVHNRNIFNKKFSFVEIAMLGTGSLFMEGYTITGSFKPSYIFPRITVPNYPLTSQGV